MTDNRINAEVLSISAAGAYMDMGARYEGYLHTKDKDIWISMIEYVDILRDYNGNYTDYITAAIVIPLGDFVKGFYPDKDNLEITLINHTVGKVIKQRYKFIISQMDPNISAGVYNRSSLTDLNKEGMTKIVGQCVSKTIADIRDSIVYGVYKKTTVGDVLNKALMNAMNSIDIFDFAFSRNINIIPPNNTREYDQIVIPDNVHALDLPSYLQHGEYGVYNGGIGTYVQTVEDTEMLFVYPLYRKDVMTFYKTKLQIIAVASTLMSSIDSTYGMQGNILKILVSMTNVNIEDKGEKELKNKGSGIVLTESESIMKRPVEVSEKDVKVSKDNTKREYIHKKVSDGSVKKEQYSVTTNTYDSRSSVLKSDGRIIQVQWNYSNARLLAPGMGLSYIIEEDGKINTYNGVLQGVHITTDNNSKMEVSILNIFISSKPTNGIFDSSKESGFLANVMDLF